MTRFLFALLGLVIAAQAVELPDGEYVPMGQWRAGRTLTLQKGSFTTGSFSDDFSSEPADATKPPPFIKPAERGRYMIDGERLLLLGDNPHFAEVLWFRTFDGVTVLLTQKALYTLHTENVLSLMADPWPTILWPKGTLETWNANAWQAFKKKHPNFPRVMPEPE